jgi:NarL family two-component system response regulator YdfI
MINVIIFSDVAIVRAGLSFLIGSFDDFEILATTGSIDELADVQDQGVTLVIHAREATLQNILGNLRIPHPILFVQDVDEESNKITHGLDHSWGIVSSTISPEGLRAAILAVSNGLIVHSSQKSAALSSNLLPGDAVPPLVDPLTEREQMVLEKLATGLANKQIAQALDISENTVKFHISSIYSKLNASSRTDALRKGAKLGLVAL